MFLWERLPAFVAKATSAEYASASIIAAGKPLPQKQPYQNTTFLEADFELPLPRRKAWGGEKRRSNQILYRCNLTTHEASAP
jgi:hypothetical protein